MAPVINLWWFFSGVQKEYKTNWGSRGARPVASVFSLPAIMWFSQKGKFRSKVCWSYLVSLCFGDEKTLQPTPAGQFRSGQREHWQFWRHITGAEGCRCWLVLAVANGLVLTKTPEVTYSLPSKYELLEICFTCNLNHFQKDLCCKSTLSWMVSFVRKA